MEDVERVAAFYRDVLRMPERARHVRDDGSLRSIWIETSPDGSFLAIEELREGARGTLGHSLVALRIERADRSAWLAHFEQHGVAIEKQSRWTLYVKDPEGNVIGLSHHPRDPL